MGLCLGKKKVHELENQPREILDNDDDPTQFQGEDSDDNSIAQPSNYAKTVKYTNPNTRSTIICKSNGDVLIESESDDSDSVSESNGSQTSG
jgi:hypothetical protein